MESEDVVLFLVAKIHALNNIFEVGLSRKIVAEKVVMLLHHYSEVLVNVLKPLVLGHLGNVSEILLDVQLVFEVKLLVLYQVTRCLLLDIDDEFRLVGLLALQVFDVEL